MVLPRALARFNRVATNPFMGLFADRVLPWAMVVHQGRQSGRTYQTPVWAFRDPVGFAIALTYGEQVDWLANLRAAGGGQLHRAGAVIAVTEERIARGPIARSHIPPALRPALRALGVGSVLLLRPVAQGVSAG